MTRSAYLLRALLYMAVAALPEIRMGIEHKLTPLDIALGATFAALVALRAFVDKSPSEVDPPAPEDTDAS